MLSARSRGSEKARATLQFLRAKIRSGEWEVGELIPKESELMVLIGVGKSTVREAVRSLATYGMLQTVPGVGTFVRSRTPTGSVIADFLADHDLEEVLIYRRSLEIEAAQTAAVQRTEEQLAALRASYERSLELANTPFSKLTPEQVDEVQCNRVGHPNSFHRLIVEASGSTLLVDLYAGVMQTLSDAESRGQIALDASHETVLADHAALLRAIETRSVRDAAHAMALHADRDLALRTDMLEFGTITERSEELIEAGYEPLSLSFARKLRRSG